MRRICMQGEKTQPSTTSFPQNFSPPTSQAHPVSIKWHYFSTTPQISSINSSMLTTTPTPCDLIAKSQIAAIRIAHHLSSFSHRKTPQTKARLWPILFKTVREAQRTVVKAKQQPCSRLTFVAVPNFRNFLAAFRFFSSSPLSTLR